MSAAEEWVFLKSVDFQCGSPRPAITRCRSRHIGPQRWSWLMCRDGRDVAEGEAGDLEAAPAHGYP